MLTDFITLFIVIAIFCALQQLIEVLRQRVSAPKHTLLELLGFDAQRHELVVLLRNGNTIYGSPDPLTGASLKDGLILIDARGPKLAPREGLTFIAGDSITAVSTQAKPGTPEQ